MCLLLTTADLQRISLQFKLSKLWCSTGAAATAAMLACFVDRNITLYSLFSLEFIYLFFNNISYEQTILSPPSTHLVKVS